jgi:NifB/MoaA-like Fe-S oxidoreductase
VVAVDNQYFGSEIVVAGLMTGQCVLAAQAQFAGEFVVLPKTAHKSDEPVMLDGTTLEELERRLGLTILALDFEGFAQLVAAGR